MTSARGAKDGLSNTIGAISGCKTGLALVQEMVIVAPSIVNYRHWPEMKLPFRVLTRMGTSTQWTTTERSEVKKRERNFQNALMPRRWPFVFYQVEESTPADLQKDANGGSVVCCLPCRVSTFADVADCLCSCPDLQKRLHGALVEGSRGCRAACLVESSLGGELESRYRHLSGLELVSAAVCLEGLIAGAEPAS